MDHLIALAATDLGQVIPAPSEQIGIVPPSVTDESISLISLGFDLPTPDALERLNDSERAALIAHGGRFARAISRLQDGTAGPADYPGDIGALASECDAYLDDAGTVDEELLAGYASRRIMLLRGAWLRYAITIGRCRAAADVIIGPGG